MKSFKQHILLEATHNLDDDVDYIYSKYLDAFYKRVMSNTTNFDRINLPDITFPSSELPSAPSRDATKINPIDIFIGVGAVATIGGGYMPLLKKLAVYIPEESLRFLRNIVGLRRDVKYSLDSLFSKGEEKMTLSLMNGTDIRGIIVHELTHWIDDTKYANILTNICRDIFKNMNNPKKKESLVKLLRPTAYHEVNAQVHYIKQLKRDVGDDEWDTYTMNDLISRSDNFTAVREELRQEVIDKYKNLTFHEFQKMFPDVKTPEEAKEILLKKVMKSDASWKKSLLTRMAREGLLGKRMK